MRMRKPMPPIQRIAAATLFLLAGACAHTGAAPQADDSQVLARVGDQVITRGEFEELARGRLVKLEVEHQKKLHATTKEILERWIEVKLIEAEAARLGTTPQELVQREVIDEAENVPEEELRALYDRHSEKLEQSYDEARERLERYLVRKRTEQLRLAFMAELYATTPSELLLEYPELPVVDVDDAGPAKGPHDAPITIVEFSDFQCPFCKRMQPTLDELMERYPGQIRIVYRHFPIGGHQLAEPAARASACAEEQGRFWAYHDLVFEHQAELSETKLTELAARAGLEMERFEICLAEDRYAERVRGDYTAGLDAGVRGTPAFFVNGRPIFGAETVDTFEQVIERELARSQS